jgi:hypothetical protein
LYRFGRVAASINAKAEAAPLIEKSVALAIKPDNSMFREYHGREERERN